MSKEMSNPHTSRILSVCLSVFVTRLKGHQIETFFLKEHGCIMPSLVTELMLIASSDGPLVWLLITQTLVVSWAPSCLVWFIFLDDILKVMCPEHEIEVCMLFSSSKYYSSSHLQSFRMAPY